MLNVRSGAGTNFRAKKFTELTSDAQRQILALSGRRVNGYVRGVTFSCSGIVESGGHHWGKTPSGYVALEWCERMG